MRKAFKVLLMIIAGLLVIVGIAAAYVAMRDLPEYDPPEIPEVKIDYTPQRVEEGARLASMLCKGCHYNEETDAFSGKLLTDIPQFGNIYSKNITKDHEAGIGSWTDGQLVYFIRTGLKPNGQYVPPYMPKLAHISDEDLYSIVSFLRSDHKWVEANKTQQPTSELSFLSNFLLTIGAFKPFEYPDKPIPQPDTSNPVEFGKYIALYQLECFSCHSKDFATNDYLQPEKSPGFFAGGNKLYDLEGNIRYSKNITMHETTGIGKWSEEEFVKAVKYGIVPDNEPALQYPMMPYTNLTDKEAKAIYAYLKSIPKIENKVEEK